MVRRRTAEAASDAAVEMMEVLEAAMFDRAWGITLGAITCPMLKWTIEK